MHSMEESHKDYERAIGNSDLGLLHGLLSWSVSPPPLDIVSFVSEQTLAVCVVLDVFGALEYRVNCMG